MPPEDTHDPESQQSQPTSRQRWKSLAAAGRALVAWSIASRLRTGLLRK